MNLDEEEGEDEKEEEDKWLIFQKLLSRSSKYLADNTLKSYNILVSQIKLRHLFHYLDTYLDIYNIGKGSHSRSLVDLIITWLLTRTNTKEKEKKTRKVAEEKKKKKEEEEGLGGERHDEMEDRDRDERREVINGQSGFGNLMARLRAFA